jgi:hypothetical protein
VKNEKKPHVFETFRKAKVVVEDGKIVEVGKSLVMYCWL